MLKTVRITNYNQSDKTIQLSDNGSWVVPANGSITLSLYDYVHRLTDSDGVWRDAGRLKGLVITMPETTGEDFNIKRYGAVGDGVHDDTESIQRASDAAFKSGGGSIYVPSGIFSIGRLVMRENVSMTGGGHSGIIDGAVLTHGKGCGIKDVRIGAGV